MRSCVCVFPYGCRAACGKRHAGWGSWGGATGLRMRPSGFFLSLLRFVNRFRFVRGRRTRIFHRFGIDPHWRIRAGERCGD